MYRRKIAVVLLTLVLCVVFSTPAFADDTEVYKLDKTYSSYYYNDIYFPSYVISGYFTVPAKGKITLRYECNGYDPNETVVFGIYDYGDYADAKVNIMVHPKYNEKRGKYIYEKSVVLPKGKYYIGGTNDNWQFDFSLKYRPTFSKTSITKIFAKKKGFTVKYKKAKYATGYQIRYSTSSKMTNAKIVKATKLTRRVSKLKAKKKYYVQVRSFKKVKVNGVMKTYYSDWSAKKAIKTR